MSIPIRTATELIRLMEKMPEYPGQWTAVENQMILALSEGARDYTHAESVINRLLASRRFAPMPCDITELIVADYAAQSTPAEEPGSLCPRCSGSGWATDWELVTWTDPAHKHSERISRERYREILAEPPESGRLAQEVVRRCRHEGAAAHAPSPETNGPSNGSLTDGMTLEEIARWQALADRTTDKARKAIALGVIADFYRRHPHLAPKQRNGDAA